MASTSISITTTTTTTISEILTPQHYLLNRTDIPRSGGNIFILDPNDHRDSVHPVIISCPWHLKTVVDVAHHFSHSTAKQCTAQHTQSSSSIHLPLKKQATKQISDQTPRKKERKKAIGFTFQATNRKIISTMVFPNRSRLQSNSSGAGI